ncbi:hypothetical protein Scep_007452 [Stephania cephalantha]|uniref:Uncharacterized protein n=1 Tax=Stephania cephalantha TaxID=152367 RepID=A0AAP0KCK5_9MAGN
MRRQRGGRTPPPARSRGTPGSSNSNSLTASQGEWYGSGTSKTARKRSSRKAWRDDAMANPMAVSDDEASLAAVVPEEERAGGDLEDGRSCLKFVRKA